ncbi:MAG TPA: nuclear transport factor 2 family protein [Arenimonas sp.]|uniref:nuclear transport factor 2 family protein n=1 Tax=Arenimonas sp. TaxID=1872635 RepID=UPI002BE990D8|nr:nuclear transport factor 2 family protein [Arenimonas sp.]HMB55818.1 nuclear transport factor 2 family protein [Arenimonas sp.]
MQMQTAAEKQDIDGVLAPVAEDFSGSDGMDRNTLRHFIAISMLGKRDVGVTLGPLDVKMFGDRATVNFTAATSAGSGPFPEQAQIYQVNTGWRLVGGDWKLISATWEPSL